jgi:hypothetical protein
VNTVGVVGDEATFHVEKLTIHKLYILNLVQGNLPYRKTFISKISQRIVTLVETKFTNHNRLQLTLAILFLRSAAAICR